MEKSEREMAERSNLDKENVDPKKRRLLLLLMKKKKVDYFGMTSKEQLKATVLYTMPKNTATSSKWALKNFSEWFTPSQTVTCSDGPVNVWEQGRDENTQEDCPTIET